MPNKHTINEQKAPKTLLIINMVMAFVYIAWWFQIDHVGNPVLYALLFIGEIYHLVMALSYWITIWPNKQPEKPIVSKDFQPSVDILIPVVNEPLSVIEETVKASLSIDYTNHTVNVLNDGFVAGNENWEDIDNLAKDLGVNCITRTTPGGYKAGNINNALKQLSGDIVVIFDADMIAEKEFLQEVIPYFQDETVGFVQTPQYYINNDTNEITQGAWQQQELFFGPIMEGKGSKNSAFICGTNVAIRRAALDEAGGMCEDNIAEDFLTSLFVHENGWKSHYVLKVLSTGLAPEDLLSYYKQQLRWARGSLEVLFGFNPLFRKGLSVGQKFQYLFSALYYLNGLIVAVDIIVPLLYLFFGLNAVDTSSTSFTIFFVPFMALNLYTLYVSTREHLSFKAISFSQSSWVLQLAALQSVLLNRKMSFAVTPKKAQSGNFLSLAYPHIAYLVIGGIAIIFGVVQQGVTPAVVTNSAWILFNSILFVPFIKAAYPWSTVWNKTLSKITLRKPQPTAEIIN